MGSVRGETSGGVAGMARLLHASSRSSTAVSGSALGGTALLSTCSRDNLLTAGVSLSAYSCALDIGTSKGSPSGRGWSVARVDIGDVGGDATGTSCLTILRSTWGSKGFARYVVTPARSPLAVSYAAKPLVRRTTGTWRPPAL